MGKRAGRSRIAAAGAVRSLSRLSRSVGGRDQEDDGRGRAARHRAGKRRQALAFGRMDRAPDVRRHAPVLPAQSALPAESRQQCQGHRRGDAAQGELRHPPDDRRHVADQFRADQPGRAESHLREQGREFVTRADESRQRSRTRQWPPRPHPDRHGRLRGRQGPCRHARRCHLPQCGDGADPVCARDGHGAPAPDPHRPALDQQILHHGHAPAGLADPLAD